MGNKFLSAPLSPVIPSQPCHPTPPGPPRPEPPHLPMTWQHEGPCGLLSLCSSFPTHRLVSQPHQSGHLFLDVPCRVPLPNLCSLTQFRMLFSLQQLKLSSSFKSPPRPQAQPVAPSSAGWGSPQGKKFPLWF